MTDLDYAAAYFAGLLMLSASILAIDALHGRCLMNDQDHAKRLIADLANAMQACVGSMPDMDRDELRALAERLTTMTRIVLRALNAPEPSGATWPHAASAAFPPPYTCEYGDSPHACRARATHVIEWRTHQGNVRTYVCDEHEPVVRAAMRGT